MIDIAFRRGPVEFEPGPSLTDGGGECVFLGRTRAETHSEFGPLLALTYEAYESMAINTLRHLVHEVAAEHPLRYVCIRHSLGDVPVGAASVFIQVLCPHRAPAFAACRFLIDRLKTDVPIWKGEVWERGRTWSAGHTPTPAP